MVRRIVKMTFRPESCQEFLDLFDLYKQDIRFSPGCESLELLRLAHDGNIFFTYSTWLGEEYLEQYRHSATFAEVWPRTRALFAAPAEAWTVDVIHHLV